MTFSLANEEETSTDNDHQNMDPLSNDYNLDSQLTPFEKLEKYFQSEELMERLDKQIDRWMDG